MSTTPESPIRNGTEETEPSQQPIGSPRRLTKINAYGAGMLCGEVEFNYSEDGLIVGWCERYIMEDAFSSEESKTEITYDSQSRMIKSETNCSWTPNIVDQYTEYTYNSKGLLINKSEGGSSGEQETSYAYNEQGKLIKSETESLLGTETILYFYDKSGVLIKTRMIRNDVGTQEEIVTEDLDPIPCGDYKPFVIDEDENGTSNIMITDKEGQAIWCNSLNSPKFTADKEGYLIWAEALLMGNTVVYEFLYDGEESQIVFEQENAADDETVQEDVTDDKSAAGDGKLQYPISEEDCYIIYKNYFGYEMAEGDSMEVVVERSGTGKKEMLMFAIYRINPNTGGYSMAGLFVVYVNTGVCERNDIVFQAEDYFY